LPSIHDDTPGIRSPVSAHWPPARHLLPLVLIVLLGAWLRCWQAGESLWVDELHTSWVVAADWSSVAARARAGNQSPLYFYLVWCVVQLFGHDEWTLRLISLVAGSGLIMAAGALVRRWSGEATAGLLAALLVAVHRDCIFYAQEARPYALLQVSAVGHAALFVVLVQRPTRLVRAGFVLGAAWLFHLHYTSFLFLLAELVCLVVWWCSPRRRAGYGVGAAVVDALSIGLLMLPAAGHVSQIVERRDNWSGMVAALPATGLQINFFLFVLLPVVGLGLGRVLGLPRTSFRWRSLAGTWSILWMSVPPALAVLTTWHGVAALAMVRYLVISLVGAMVFAALCQASHVSRAYRAIFAAIVVVSAIGLSGMVQQWKSDGRWIGDRREPWSALVDWLNSRWPGARLPVLLCPGLLEDAALSDRADADLKDYCLFPVQGLYPLHAQPLVPLRTSRDVRVSDDLRRVVERQGGAWVVIRARRTTADAVIAALARQLDAAPIESRQFDTLRVVRLARPSS